jgi:hypothetical protein
MVLFLNSQSTNIEDDVRMICKMMYNVEINRKIFKLDGTPEIAEVCKESFNSYTYQQINYNISPSYGVLVIYGGSIPVRSFATLLERTFQHLDLYDGSALSPYSLYSNKSTAYTLISKDSAGLHGTSSNLFQTHYRKLITNLHDLPRALTSGSKFIWCIVKASDKPYLFPPELSSVFPSEHYLNRALSTIIYDGMKLLNVKHGMMQINYPALSQYTISDKSLIIPELVYISGKMGLLPEIASYYCDSAQKESIFSNLPREFQEFTIGCIKYDATKVRRLDPSKPWHVQLNTPWDYQDQEEQEKNIKETGKPAFHNDVCFLSQIPLHKTVYLIEVVSNKERPPVDTIETDLKDPIVSCIFVSPYIMHSEFKSKCRAGYKIRLPIYLSNYGYKIISCSTVEFPRTEIAVIKEINKDKISDKKRKLLYTISKYGCMGKPINFSETILYTFNPGDNQIYCGFSGQINDTEILAYQNTNTILFRYNDIRYYS